MPVIRNLRQRLVAIGAASGIVLAVSVPLVSGIASAAAGVTTFDQCRNGAVGTPPSLIACAGSAWSNGNLNGTNSHWAEGEFVPYRAAVSGLAAGSHDLAITYRPADSGAHAIDYLGSFDATESTASIATTQHENHADPCADITMGAGWCSPGSPTASVDVSAPDFAGADNANCGTNGAFAGPQVEGKIALFGPSGSAMTGFSYVSQNVAHGNGCETTVDVSFTLSVDTGSDNIVLAWGGHVASGQEWGTGNSAASIDGSPYHMSLDSVDGTGTGSMDRSMNATAISSIPGTPDPASDPGSATVTPTTTTILMDVATGQPWFGDETTGAAVFDTATISGTDGPIPTGTVTYTYFTNGTCVGSGTTETVALTDGVPADASATAPLGAGRYSYDAVYNGDGAYTPSAVSACEPFTVQPAPTTVTNIVVSHQTGQPWSGTETAGGAAKDATTLSGGVSGFVPTGTVTYSYFADEACGGAPVWTDTVTLTGAGDVPDSNLTDPLAAGVYAFETAYSGDTNYASSGASACEAFVVTPITRVGPPVTPSGNADGGGTTTSSDPASGASALTPAPTMSTPAPAPQTPPAVPAAHTGPATLSALAETGAGIALMAGVGLALLALGSLLVVASRRRGEQA